MIFERNMGSPRLVPASELLPKVSCCESRDVLRVDGSVNELFEVEAIPGNASLRPLPSVIVPSRRDCVDKAVAPPPKRLFIPGMSMQQIQIYATKVCRC
ncbi:hypothetical protein ACOME3_010428 [Neoechinorhynchus agilis]